MRIVADERERKSGIPDLLAKAGVRAEVRTLPVGDYVVAPETVAERKSMHDLVSSVFDGRLFDQCSRLREHFESPVLLVEGNVDEMAEVAENPMVLYGALSRVAIDFRIPVVPTPSADHTARLLVALAARCCEGAGAGGSPPRGPFLKKIRKHDDLRRQQLSSLASLPGVGEKIAARMLARFGTPIAALGATSADLAKIEGLGGARARRIRGMLDAGEAPEGGPPAQRTLNGG